MEKMTKEQAVQLSRAEAKRFMDQLTLLINSYYFVMEASDIIVREVYERMDMIDLPVLGYIKVRHRMLMQELRNIITKNENFWKDYEKAFADDFVKYEEIRQSANFIARIVLLTVDRTHLDDDADERAHRIERYIYNMPTDVADDHFLKRFFKR